MKFDILGLKNLSVLRIACELIKARHSIDLDINNLEPDDADVFEMIRKGNTMGIFQIESPGMTQVFTGLDKVDFNSLSAGVALYRWPRLPIGTEAVVKLGELLERLSWKW